MVLVVIYVEGDQGRDHPEAVDIQEKFDFFIGFCGESFGKVSHCSFNCRKFNIRVQVNIIYKCYFYLVSICTNLFNFLLKVRCMEDGES